MTDQKNPDSGQSMINATILIAFFSLLSRVLGLARDRLLAASFGAEATLDAYYAAFRIPDFLYNLLILGTLSAAFIPVFTESLVTNRTQAWRTARTILNLTILVISFLSLLLAVLAPQLTGLIVPGFSEEQKSLTTQLTRIMLLAPIFFSVSSVFSSILNSFRKFAIVAAAPLMYNASIIVGILVLYPIFGPTGLALGVAAGAFLHMALQIPSILRAGFRWAPDFNLNLPSVRKIGTLFVPRIFGMDTSQVSLFIASVIGSGLASGTISVYNLANNLQSLPIGIVAVAFAVVAFPHLSKAAAERRMDDFRMIFSTSLSQILFFVVPLSAMLVVMRAQIVRLILGAGLFDWTDTIRTLDTLAVFAASLSAQSLIPLCARAFYSVKNTKIPVAIGLLSAIINIIMAYILSPEFGVAGLAAAFSISAIFNFAALFVLLEFKLGGMLDSGLLLKIEKIVIATFVMGAVAYGSLYAVAPLVDTHTVFGLSVQAFVSAVAGGAAYLFAAWLLNISEGRDLVATLKMWQEKLRAGFARIPGIGW